MAANRSHPAFTVSPRARASIPQHTAPTMATMTQIPYRPRRLPMSPSYLFPKAPLTLSHASTTQKRIEHAPGLRAEREQPRGGEAHQDDERRADDRRVEEDLEGCSPARQAEDVFEGVVRVGEGDEIPHGREGAGRAPFPEEAGDVDQGKQDRRRVQEHVGRRGCEVRDKDPYAVRRYERREHREGGGEDPDERYGVQEVDEHERRQELHEVEHRVNGEDLKD